MNMWKTVYGAFYQLKIPSNGKVIIPDEKPIVLGRTYQRHEVVVDRGRYRIVRADDRIVSITPVPEYVIVWDGGEHAYRLYRDGRTEDVPVNIVVDKREETIVKQRRKGRDRNKWKVYVTRYLVTIKIIDVGGIVKFTDKHRTKIAEAVYKWDEAEKLGLVR